MLISVINHKNKKSRGFSLVEILIFIAISSILMAMASSMFRAYEKNRNLKEAAAAIMSDIKLAKQRSMAESVQYTITIDQDNNLYRIQGGATDTTKNMSNFKGGISITDQNYAGDTITFNTRGTCTAGNVTIQNSRGSSIRIITSPMGRVRSEEVLK